MQSTCIISLQGESPGRKKIQFASGLVIFICLGLRTSKDMTRQSSVSSACHCFPLSDAACWSCLIQEALTEVGCPWGFFVFSLTCSDALKLAKVRYLRVHFGASSKVGNIVRKLREPQKETWLWISQAVCDFTSQSLSFLIVKWWMMTFSWVLLQNCA